jgi:folate-dependent phosphoribosylglycinamide formyltransferase PurN
VEATLDLAVLTSGARGVALAWKLSTLAEVRSLTVVTTRVSPFRQSWPTKLKRIRRFEGNPGLLRAAVRRLRHPFRPTAANLAALVARDCPQARHLHYDDLHAPEAISGLRAIAPDLGVVFATYRLRPEVFAIPKLGCLNLHLGRAPEFKGSSPAFYEMLEGVPMVGITVHRVSEALDAGPIVLQELFPLDLVPPGDPLAYLARYQAEVLVPNGLRMMAEAVRRVARREAEDRPQPICPARPRSRATYALKRELRRRVAARRAHDAPSLVRAFPLE